MFDGMPPDPSLYSQCYIEVARQYTLPASLLPAIARIEGGKVGQSSLNKNGTRDHGIMQINDVWVDKLNKAFGITAEQIRNNPCVSIRVAGYILRYEINLASGDFWKGVGRYHSRSLVLHTNYIQKVFATASMMEPAYQALSYQFASN